MTEKAQSSPSPSEVGYSVFGRRRFLTGVAGAVGAGAVVAACGSDDDEPASTEAATDEPAATDAPAGGDAPAGDVGVVTVGSNDSDEVPKAALAAALATTGVETEVNTIDHNTYQENFNTYVQQPDDVMKWFSGYRLSSLAAKGVFGDLSDLWAGGLDAEYSEGFKNAATGRDGKQYAVPLTFYCWGVHYRKSLFEENGYAIPDTWEEFLALCAQMETDGLTPLAAANGGRWPQMGMFDMLNVRINGYEFHISLMGGNESWTDDKVKAVFAAWDEILAYYQPDANGREWQDAAVGIGDKSAGMMLIGNFIAENFPDDPDIVDDIDFFLFPEINPEFGKEAIEAPMDTMVMAASPENEDGAKALLLGMGQSAAGEAWTGESPSTVAANGNADRSAYGNLQVKAAEQIATATFISQFLDRDTDPSFAGDVVGVALADYLTDPSQIDTILQTVEEQAATYVFE